MDPEQPSGSQLFRKIPEFSLELTAKAARLDRTAQLVTRKLGGNPGGFHSAWRRLGDTARVSLEDPGTARSAIAQYRPEFGFGRLKFRPEFGLVPKHCGDGGSR